jgi:hypothetical protein
MNAKIETNFHVVERLRSLIVEQVTEPGLDAVMASLDKWSIVLAWSAVAASLLFILIPALVTVWTR